MADHSKPTTTSTYVNFVSELDGRLDDISVGLDPAVTTATNLATNSIRWTSASNKWQKYNGTTWADLSSAYTININGSVGATTPNSGAFTTLSATGNVTLGDSSADTVTINGTVQAGVVISGSTSTDALRITQTGTGNALVVEDSANPDSTPFVVSQSGQVIIGNASSVTTGGFTVAPFQIHGVSVGYAASSTTAWNSGVDVGSSILLARSAGTTVGDYTAVASGATLGNLRFYGSDGSAFVEAAKITAAVDGTPGTNDMPGRLVFSTTADGASSPTERMRIRSDGGVSIGGSGAASVSLYIEKNITGATTSYGLYASGEAQSGVTVVRNVTSVSNVNVSASLTSYTHFYATQGTVSGTVTNQYGFSSATDLLVATNNYGFLAGNTAAITSGKTAYGFYSGVNTATGGGTTYGFYAAGTANNYFAGQVGIKSVPSGTYELEIKQAASVGVNIESTGVGVNYASLRIASGSNSSTISVAGGAAIVPGVLQIDNTNNYVAMGASTGFQIDRTTVTSPATTDGNVFSGTYTPTLTNTTNVASSTASACQYMRVGNIVTVSGQVAITPTASITNTVLGMSLPIASALSATRQLGGTAVAQTTTQVATLYADATNDRVLFRLQPAATTALTYAFSFTYQVV